MHPDLSMPHQKLLGYCNKILKKYQCILQGLHKRWCVWDS